MAWASYRQSIRTFLSSPAMLSMAGGLIATGVYVGYTDTTRNRRMIKTFEYGNIYAPMVDQFEIFYYPRPDVEEEIRRILKPTFASEYFLVNGEVGVGKSRVILQIARQMVYHDEPKGKGAPIYVLANESHNFASTLAGAVNFYFDEHINFKYFLDFVMRIHSMPSIDEKARLVRVLEAIEESAFLYMVARSKPVVLIIDGINNLSENQIELLQAKAKLWADSNAVKVIFVNNDERTERLLQKNASRWSRMAVPIVVQDLNKEEAIKFLRDENFLVNMTGKYCPEMPLETATKVVNLIGGRLLNLIVFKRDWLEGIPYEVTEQDLINCERDRFIAVKTRSSANAWKVITVLKNAPGLKLPLAKLAKETSLADICTLAQENMVRYATDETGVVMVKFRSKLTKRVISEMED